MSDADERNSEPPEERDRPGLLEDYRPLLGIVFVVLLVLGAVWMMERMRHYATLGDCAFAPSPRCRDLIDR